MKFQSVGASSGAAFVNPSGTTGSKKSRVQTARARRSQRAQRNERGRLDQLIAANRRLISDLDTRLTAAESNVTALDARLTTAEGDISSNDADILTLQIQMVDAQADIIENAKAGRYSEYRCSGVADINAAPPYQFVFNNVHVEDGQATNQTTGNTRIEVLTDGTYRLDWRCTYFSGTPFIGLFAYIVINGTTQIFGGAEGLVAGASAQFSSSNGSYQVPLVTRDYVEMFVTRHAAVAGATFMHSDHTYLRLTKLGENR